MISGSVPDAEKPITIVARGGLLSVWLRVRGSHDVQSSLSADAHQQDGYPDATESRCSLSNDPPERLLDGGVHTRSESALRNQLVCTRMGCEHQPRLAAGCCVSVNRTHEGSTPPVGGKSRKRLID